MTTITSECREKCATCPSIGSFNRLNYDNCAYDKKIQESTSPLMYQMSRYKYENCARCTYDGKQYAPFDLVDEESELLNITRSATRCPSREYNPMCKKSDNCLSTYDKDVPVIYPPNLCPVVCNNIQKMKTPGYSLKKQNYCDGNTFNQINGHYFADANFSNDTPYSENGSNYGEFRGEYRQERKNLAERQNRFQRF